jgi:hypothetical protein
METVSQNKNHSCWDSESHYTTFGENSLYFPEIGARGMFSKTDVFMDTFGLRK